MFLFNNCGKAPSSSDPSSPGQSATPTPTPTLTCVQELQTTAANTEWSNETLITITGYVGQAMEPQISADGVVLFFNDKYPGDTDMDIHYAVKSTDTVFNYAGKLSGADVLNVMDGVPAIDSSNRFYFMSLRDYGLSGRYRSIFKGDLYIPGGGGLALTNVVHADANFSNGTPPTGGVAYVDMDIGLSWDGTKAVVASTEFKTGQGYPGVSKMGIYSIDQVTRQLSLDSDSASIMANINAPDCRVYAPTMSIDKKELYYTALQIDSDGSNPIFKMLVAKRNSITEPFGKGAIIQGITGELTEGLSISYHDSGKTLYYHKKDPADGYLKIYKVTRP